MSLGAGLVQPGRSGHTARRRGPASADLLQAVPQLALERLADPLLAVGPRLGRQLVGRPAGQQVITVPQVLAVEAGELGGEIIDQCLVGLRHGVHKLAELDVLEVDPGPHLETLDLLDEALGGAD